MQILHVDKTSNFNIVLQSLENDIILWSCFTHSRLRCTICLYNVHSHNMYCIESIWKTSKRSARFTNWWPEHHTAYDHFKCSCLRWVCLTAILIKSVTKSPWRNCCDYEQRPFSWVLGSQAVDTTPPPPSITAQLSVGGVTGHHQLIVIYSHNAYYFSLYLTAGWNLLLDHSVDQ